MANKTSRGYCVKASPLVAATAGAAVCLSGEVAQAVSGNIAASNGGNSAFGLYQAINVFNALASFQFTNHASISHAHFQPGAGSILAANTGISYVRHVGAGFTVSAGIGFGGTWTSNTAGHANTYIPVQFNDGSGTRFGWIHCVTMNANGHGGTFDTWAYDQTGGNIITLDESVTAKKLALSDGKVKLHWTNANEDGVARYEVQAKDADGAWSAVESDTPGAGSYSASVSGGGTYRLLVENSDGSTRTLGF